jgi:glycosyltransferase involved in cell wall biosynthesis
VRLAFLVNLFPPYVVGGNEMLCADVVAALRARGHEVSVVCGQGERLRGAPGIHPVLEVDLDRKDETFLGARQPSAWESFRLHVFSPASYLATRRALGTARPDLAIAWNLYMASLAPLVAARAAGLPIVTHVADKWLHYGLNDVAPLLRLRASAHGRFLRLHRWLRPALARWAAPGTIVAISDFMRRFYVDSGFPEGGIQTVRLGVPTSRFLAPQRRARPGDVPLRLLYVGALWEGKGPQDALRALGGLRRAGLNAELDMCGTGSSSFLAWLRSIVEEEKLAPCVRFHGFQPTDAVARFYRECDILVFPSRWDEPFAAVPVEAMSSGMAIVATTAGGTPEALVDGRDGLLVAPGEVAALTAAVARLAAEPELRLRLGTAAAERARREFEFEDYVARLEAIYRDRAQAAKI